jgi:hypothetical protein
MTLYQNGGQKPLSAPTEIIAFSESPLSVPNQKDIGTFNRTGCGGCVVAVHQPIPVEKRPFGTFKVENCLSILYDLLVCSIAVSDVPGRHFPGQTSGTPNSGTFTATTASIVTA